MNPSRKSVAVAVYLAYLPCRVDDDVRREVFDELSPGIGRIYLEIREYIDVSETFRLRLLIYADNLLHVIAGSELLDEHRAHVSCCSRNEYRMLHSSYRYTLPRTDAE